MFLGDPRELAGLLMFGAGILGSLWIVAFAEPDPPYRKWRDSLRRSLRHWRKP